MTAGAARGLLPGVIVTTGIGQGRKSVRSNFRTDIRCSAQNLDQGVWSLIYERHHHEGITNRYQYFLSVREYAEKKPEVLAVAMEELGTVGKWVRQNYKEAAAELAPIQGLEPDVIEAALRHYQHTYRPIDDTVLTDQQKIADAFFELRLIPKRISVRDAVLPANR